MALLLADDAQRRDAATCERRRDDNVGGMKKMFGRENVIVNVCSGLTGRAVRRMCAL